MLVVIIGLWSWRGEILMEMVLRICWWWFRLILGKEVDDIIRFCGEQNRSWGAIEAC